MSLTRQVAHNTIIQMVGKIASTLIGVIALGMLARYLGVEKMGWYTTSVGFLQFIGILTDFGLIPVTAQMLGEENGLDKKKLLNNLFGFRLTSSLIFFAFAPFIALLFPYPPEIHQAIWLSAIGFVGIGLNQIFTGYFQYKLKMHIQAFGELLSRIILIACMLIVVLSQTSFLQTIALLVVPNIAFTLFLFLGARTQTPIRPSFDFKIWKIICIKMWPIAISILFNVIYLKGDLVILSYYRSQTEIGLYGSAYRVVDILSQTAMLFMGLILPLLAASWSNKKFDEMQNRSQKAFEGLMMLTLPAVAGVMVLAPRIMTLINGKEFILAGAPLRVLAFAILGVFIGSFFGHMAVAINAQKKTIWIYLSSAVLTLLGYFICIPRFGMMGAAWMSVFSEMYVGLMLMLVIYPLSKVKLDFLPLFKSIFAAGVMVGVLLSLHTLPTVLLILIGGTVYGTILFVTGGISKEIVKVIISKK